jgi:hypothetical protein
MADNYRCTTCRRPVVGCVCLLSALDSMRAHHAMMMQERDAARAATAEWERAYQGALADEKRARRDALEEAARVADGFRLRAEAAAWPVDVGAVVAAAIRALAGVTP